MSYKYKLRVYLIIKRTQVECNKLQVEKHNKGVLHGTTTRGLVNTCPLFLDTEYNIDKQTRRRAIDEQEDNRRASCSKYNYARNTRRYTLQRR